MVPKKGGFTVIRNEKNELIPTRTMTGFRVCIDYKKIENLITIAPKDQEKTTFTCPYGTFAFRRMPFGLCNAPATFQRCMMFMFLDLVEDDMEIFMDDFSIYGSSCEKCLENLEIVLQRCQDKNLALNWEKFPFMVIEGIVLGHKISTTGLEVDQAKVSIIKTLLPPTIV